jgi:hypothetical protein
METAPLKSFATWARTALIREVTARIAVVLAQASPERVEQPNAVRALEKAVNAAGGGEAGRVAVADKAAYTWFNRIIALRFMDANGYTGIGVVSPERGRDGGQPEMLAEAKRGNIDSAVVTNTRTGEAVTSLLNGTRRSDDPQGEAYALLLAEHCRHWNRTMPFMFEREGDFTELLIPANLLADDSVLARAVAVLTEEVCQDVEVIGWLYQFYIAERKDEIFAGFKENKKAGAAEIPAATQLFTPHWIVRYLVENSLGRLWLLNRPTSRLAEQMDYYVAPIDEEADFLKVTSPEELKVIDPACGSGHMLTYAFDLLYAIYEEDGHAPADIPGLILANNLYGTEIDPRAGALAAFALTMKARARQRTFFNKRVEPHICVLESIAFTSTELDTLVTRTGYRPDEEAFWNQFGHADTFGFLIRPSEELLVGLARHVREGSFGADDLLSQDLLSRAQRVLLQAEFLVRPYQVLVANPPYMGSGNMDDRLTTFAGKQYPLSKYDLFAMFIERSFHSVRELGYVGLVTMEAWMNRSVYAKFRVNIVMQKDLRSLVHMPYLGKGRTSMGINFGISAMVFRNSSSHESRTVFQCIRHFELDPNGVPTSFPVQNDLAANISLGEFARIPGAPVVYSASEQERNALSSRPRVSDLINTREGLTTGDNDRFLRRWHEVSRERLATPSSWKQGDVSFASSRWYIFVKGGEFRRWYGNFEYVVDWELDGRRVKSNVDTRTGRVRSHNYNGEFAFREGLSWSGVSSSKFSVRFVPHGHMFDTKGPMGFAADSEDLHVALAVLNSSSADRYLGMLAPNLDFKLGHVLSLPVPIGDELRRRLAELAEQAVGLARHAWDRNETSLDFAGVGTDGGSTRLREHVRAEISRAELAVGQLASIRHEIDRVIAGAYGVEPGNGYGQEADELGDFSERSEMGDLVSYAVGCMFGRYSLDEPGLILANQGETLQDYVKRVPTPSFMPDADNVIPIVDGDWFEDDIVARFRQFLRVAFGEQHFEENLRFVTEALGVKDLRDYFVKSFYKDHVQRYKKRPIYWLFSSPKGSFNALVYMHRYTPSTASTVLNEYLREFKAKLEVSRQHHERLAVGSGTPRQQAAALKEVDRIRKVLLELDEYEHDVLYPLATQQVQIDLDDGVKANYPKFGVALKKIPGLEVSDE